MGAILIQTIRYDHFKFCVILQISEIVFDVAQAGPQFPVLSLGITGAQYIWYSDLNPGLQQN